MSEVKNNKFFIKGDMVKLNPDFVNNNVIDGLSFDKVYTVVETGPISIYVVGDDGKRDIWWNVRFLLVDEEGNVLGTPPHHHSKDV